MTVCIARYLEHSRARAFQELHAETESAKPLTKARAARALAIHLPCYLRARGRYAIGAGSEILPVLEEYGDGWRAWRLVNEDESASGWEPPLPGRTGAANAAGNPHADRKNGVWEFAVIQERAGQTRESSE